MSLDEMEIPDSFKIDIDRSCHILRSFGAREVYLFGSLTKGSWNDLSDLDLAVRGLQPAVYFKALGELLANSIHAVDLIDLEDASPFSKRLINKTELVKIA
jgi:predicted nucleotidyltransferase